MLKNLQVKLVLIFIILTLSTMAVIGVVLVNSVTVFYADDFSAQMEDFFSDETRNMLTATANADTGRKGQALYEKLSLYSASLGLDTYRNLYILNENGDFLCGSNESLGKTLSLTENMTLAMTEGTGAKRNAYGDCMDYALLVTGEKNSYIVYVQDTKEEARDLTFTMLTIILKALAVALVIAVALSFILSKTITRPIQNITKGALKIADGDFSYKLPVAGDDEIGTLTKTFNEMAEDLESTLSAIESEKSKLSTMFLYLTDGVAAFGKNGTLIRINKTALQMLGQNYEEGKAGFAEMFAPLILTDYSGVKKAVKKGSFSADIEVNGRIFKGEFAQYKDADVGSEGVLAVLHDVTEQEEINRSRREFIANVSHELRTPITNVKSYTETILENMDDLPDDQKRKFLGVVLSESDRMIHIVKDLLLLSKFDSKKLEMTKESFDLCQVVESVTTAMNMEAEKRNQKLTYTAEEGVPTVFGDKARIEQVVVNIVSNAMKYTPDGGEIAVSVAKQDKDVSVCVKDTGVGIPADSIPHLFERFYRVDKARSRAMGGTGLGLSIAKEIMDEHKGNITIESELGKGTTVTLHFVGEEKK